MAKKTPEERARIKAETMAKRDPNKDLTAHKAARCVSAPSLSDVSKLEFNLTEEDYTRFYNELDKQSDRGAALIAAAFLEHMLMMVLMTRMAAVDDATNLWFHGEKAPFSSFYAKTRLARALGILGPISESHFDTLRKVRNLFAHSPLSVDFSTDAVAAECKKLMAAEPGWKPEYSEARRSFTHTTIQLISALAKIYDDSIDNRVPVLLI